VTDASLSWPVVVRREHLTSFEDAILDDRVAFGPGLFYFDPREDRVLWLDGGAAVALSFSGADPESLEPRRIWIVLDMLTPRLIGAARDRETALAMKR
jgi:hypothetical protein